MILSTVLRSSATFLSANVQPIQAINVFKRYLKGQSLSSVSLATIILTSTSGSLWSVYGLRSGAIWPGIFAMISLLAFSFMLYALVKSETTSTGVKHTPRTHI